MRGFIAKVLRSEARVELTGETEAERNYAVDRNGSRIVHPNTFRALFLRLKRAYTRMRSHAGTPKLAQPRSRKPHEHTGKQPDDRIASIRKPLMLILQHCQPSVVKDPLGNVVRDALTGQPLVMPHPTYVKARRLANRGRGHDVQQLARQFLLA